MPSVKRQTTHGHAALREGYVTIRFGILGTDHTVEHVELDVDPYATELARDLLIALSDQRGIAEEE